MPNPTIVKEALQQAQALGRSEEHTSELQSPCNLVCRLLLEKKKQPSEASNVIRCGGCCRQRFNRPLGNPPSQPACGDGSDQILTEQCRHTPTAAPQDALSFFG